MHFSAQVMQNNESASSGVSAPLREKLDPPMGDTFRDGTDFMTLQPNVVQETRCNLWFICLTVQSKKNKWILVDIITQTKHKTKHKMETKTQCNLFKFKSHCNFFLWQNKCINVTLADWLNKAYLSTLVTTDSPPWWSVQQLGANACPSCDSYQGPFALGVNDAEFLCHQKWVAWLLMLLFKKEKVIKTRMYCSLQWPSDGGSAQGRGCLPGGCLPGSVCLGGVSAREISAQGGVCLLHGGSTLPSRTDRHLWKHNLSATTVADCKNRCLQVRTDLRTEKTPPLRPEKEIVSMRCL